MRGWLRLALAFLATGCTPHTSATVDAGDAAVDAPRTAEAGDDAAVGDSPPSTAPEDALPTPQSDELTARTQHLLEAVIKDDPDLATDIVFPRDAYIATKDVADPGKQWDAKVMGAFKNQVHALHKRLHGIERASFTAFEIGQPVTQTVPKKRDMTRSLWRVRRSRVVYTVDGKPTHFDIGEMMSWRGAWYVLKLRGTSGT